MSTQEVGELIESVNKMTGTVAGKIGEIDQRVDQAEQEFDQFVASSDDRYKSLMSKKFRVGGQWGKYYPVRIELRGGPVNKVNIYRANTYENMGNIDGLDPDSVPMTFTASILAIGDSWGHRVPFYAFDSYHYQENKFIGKVVNHYRVQAIWVWLRGGGVDYYISHDSLYIPDSKIVSYNAETNDLSAKLAIYLGGYKNGDSGLDYQPIESANIDPSLPVNGYIRGIS